MFINSLQALRFALILFFLTLFFFAKRRLLTTKGLFPFNPSRFAQLHREYKLPFPPLCSFILSPLTALDSEHRIDITMYALMLLAALLWGVTNPLLKHYSRGMTSSGSAKDDLLFLVHRPKYLVTQVINLCGSVVFFYSLREVDVSVGSIVVNSLAFVFTVLMSVFVLREGPLRPRTAAGCLLVMLGTALCTYSSSS